MWKVLLILVPLAAFADEATLTVAPEGVSVNGSGGDRNLGYTFGDGNAAVNFSVTGSPPMYQAPVQSNGPTYYVPRPSTQALPATNALSDSDSFFKGVGKSFEAYDIKPRRHRRKDVE